MLYHLKVTGLEWHWFSWLPASCEAAPESIVTKQCFRSSCTSNDIANPYVGMGSSDGRILLSNTAAMHSALQIIPYAFTMTSESQKGLPLLLMPCGVMTVNTR